MNILEGKLLAEGQKIAIVAGRFNEIITNKLLGGAIDAFKRHGGDEKNIDIAWVPGAFEIPLVAKKIIVMTNNPMKISGLEGYGIEIVGREPIEMTCNEKDAFYLYTKYKKMGHMLHVKDFSTSSK